MQQFTNDLLPLILLFSVAVTGLLLTSSIHLLKGYHYGFLSQVHAVTVILTLIYLPFGKFFRELQAYSQVCTHLGCAVVHRPQENILFCPCHHVVFNITEGRPISGPPTRRLPRIRLEQRGDEIFAVGVEV